MITKRIGLTNNALKIIALITMTVDHIGVIFFPRIMAFRIIGRISMPIYAYMIAEGCRYTKNKLRYFLTVFSLALICQIAYYVNNKSLEMTTLVSYSFSMLLIYLINWAMKSKKYYAIILTISSFLLVGFLYYILPKIIPNFSFNYGVFCVTLPIGIYLAKGKWIKLLACGIGLVLIVLDNIEVPLQWWSLVALVPLALCNGERGKLRIKYLFYLYFPLHFVVLYGIKLLIG